jgi:dihydrofolate synthase/folylpolyglutamate synthase
MPMSAITTAAQAARFLESLVLSEPRPYQERARYALQAVGALLAQLGHPQRGLQIVHITGSKGKGSTALLLEAILRAAGYHTGTFTSPHLCCWNERFRIDGQAIGDEVFAAMLEALRPSIEALQLAKDSPSPSFFDAATAAALWLFRQQAVDYAIVEVGLGGRLDATNIVTPLVSCITSIELEHTDKLGHTLSAIAREKAGIIKPGVPVVIGKLPPEALAQVKQRALSLASPQLTYGEDFWLESVTADAQGSRGKLTSGSLRIDLELPLLGAHTLLNAALAVVCAQQLRILRDSALQQAVREGFARVTLPGRCEVLSRQPWIVVDGAHTLRSAQALRAVLDALPVTRTHWLLSFTLGKDPLAFCAALIREGDRLTLTQADPQRSQDPAGIAAVLKPRYPALEVIADPAEAVHKVRAALAPDGLLCITGSVYLAGLGRALISS